MRRTLLTVLWFWLLQAASGFSSPALSSPLFREDPQQKKNVPNSLDEQVSATYYATVANKGSVPLNPLQSTLTRVGMITYIAGMCIALPATLLPQKALRKLRILNKTQSEKAALWTGQFCALWLLRVIPFVRLETVPHHEASPEPSIWVCNHTSMLDVFMLLAADKKLRGKKKRPIKIVYWKQLEDNPVTKLLFKQCGFIPVQMANNGHGTENDYDTSSFRTLLKSTKQAVEEGFDIGILPEGQLNPNPEAGLLPAFSGAFTLAKMARRPIRMMGVHGIHRLWHPVKGMECSSRKVRIRVYPPSERNFRNADEFLDTFATVVGHFGQTGRDVEDWEAWLDGTKWSSQQMDERRETGDLSS